MSQRRRPQERAGRWAHEQVLDTCQPVGCGGEQGNKAGRSSCGPCRGRGNRLRLRSPPSSVTSQQARSLRRYRESLAQGSMTLFMLQGHSLSEVTVLTRLCCSLLKRQLLTKSGEVSMARSPVVW